MAVVDVTGGVWTFMHQAIPAENRPELWFRPVQAEVGAGDLFSFVEVKANLTGGNFTAKLESDFEVRPVIRWITNPSEPLPQNWQWQEHEWPFTFIPGGGGRIDDLMNNFRPGTIRAELGPPPAGTPDLVWIDLTNVTADGVLTYAPRGAV